MSFAFNNVYFHSILNNISFELPSQGFIAIIGPNGAGKSSLMKLMAAWHKPTQGDLFYQKKNLFHYKPIHRAHKIGWLPQERDIAWSLSVEQIIALGLPCPKRNDSLIDNILKQTDLYALRQRKVHTLSGGEKNRVHMARLMATQTQTWLLDELDAGLDWHYSFKIFSFLKKQSSEKLIIAILHDLNIVQKIADIVLLMDKGHLVSWGYCNKVMKTSYLSKIWQVSIHKGEDGWLQVDFPL